MSNAIEEARAALESIDSLAPFRYNEATDGRVDAVLASIRQADGRPLILPHPEAMTMLAAERRVFEFIVNAPTIIRNLLETVENTPETG